MEHLVNWLISKGAITSYIIAIIAVVIVIVIKNSKQKFKNSMMCEKMRSVGYVFDFVRIVIILVAVLTILQINGINITSLVAGLGIVSAIVGLALQDIIKDIIMGIRIITDSFFFVGDCVLFEDREMIVKSFNIRATKFCDCEDGSIYTVSNRNISQIRCFADRLDIQIPISYGEQSYKIEEIMGKIAVAITEIDGVSKCEYKGTKSFEDSSILHTQRIYCKQSKRADVRRKALSTAKRILDDNGIQIPFNQLDVHIEK